MQVTTIGLDIAKNVFQVHGIDVAENPCYRRERAPPVIGKKRRRLKNP
jgi:hypothetical protein